jgi:oligopeptide/dipeptide ABC transporter ATP-binding protein
VGSAVSEAAPVLVREAVPASLLEVCDLSVRFRTEQRFVQAVEGLSYRLGAGKTLGIIGESGSGKTVSCRAIMALLPESALVSGSVRFAGQELIGLSEREMRQHRGAGIAMVFQDPARSLNPTMRVGYQITEALRLHNPLDRAAAHRRAIELLDMLRVPAARQRFFAYPHELSGGMRQRIVIAMALSGNPRLLIADEATRSLDAVTQSETLLLLKELQRQLGMALIMVSHDLRMASSFADDVLVMYAGRAVEHAATTEIFRHAQVPYTRALLAAMPSVERPSHSRIPVIPGQPPDLTALPIGCAFEPRCRSARATCRDARPSFAGHRPGHQWACWYPAEDEEST